MAFLVDGINWLSSGHNKPSSAISRADQREARYRFRRYAPLVVALLLAGLPLPASAAPSQSRVDEYQIKAAFLYNFAKFVQFPPSDERPGPLVIGVLGDDPFGRILDEAVKGKTVQGREIGIRRLADGHGLRRCHIVFVSASEARHLPDIVVRAQHAGVLTVGETSHFLREGGMVRFYVEANRVRFQINADAAERAGLKINSLLLSLAQ
jgi:uncharacterized protein DUF4154